jgi:hypothetical protein
MAETAFEVRLSIRFAWWVKPSLDFIKFGLKVWSFSRNVLGLPHLTVILDDKSRLWRITHWMAAKGTHTKLIR